MAELLLAEEVVKRGCAHVGLSHYNHAMGQQPHNIDKPLVLGTCCNLLQVI